MAIEAKDVLGYLGITADTMDDLKSKFDSTFIKKDLVQSDDELVGKIWGKMVGTLETVAERAAKTLEVDLKSDEFKDLKIDRKIEKMIELGSGSFRTKLKTLEDQVKSGDSAKAIEEWEKKYKKLEDKHLQTEGLLNTTKSQFETAQNEWAGKLKANSVKTVFNESFSKVKFTDEFLKDDLKKEGFINKFNSMYEIDLDDKEKPFIKDKATGKRINSEKEAGKFMEIHEVMERDGAKFGVVNLKPGGAGTGFNGLGIFNDMGGNNNAAPDPNVVKKATQFEHILSAGSKK